MSCITRAPIPGHRRLTLVALRARLDVLQARADEHADLVPNWIPPGQRSPAVEMVPPGTQADRQGDQGLPPATRGGGRDAMTYHTRNPRRVRDHIPRPQPPPELLTPAEGSAVPGPPIQDAYELAAAAREFALSKQFALAKACIERLRAMARRPPLKDTREGRTP